MLHLPDFLLLILAAMGAGFVNALAGGGTLITFPTLIAVGVPAVVANVTSTVALLPGFFGGTLAQKSDLRGQGRRLVILVPLGALGGITGGLLLLHTGEKLFQNLVPFLILGASGLLALQDPLRGWLSRRRSRTGTGDESQDSNLVNNPRAPTTSPVPIQGALAVGLVTVYGGYFGAGMSVVLLAILGLMLDDNLTRLNALKQSIAFGVNLAAAVLFAFSGKVLLPVALAMAAGALLGGSLGGRLAGRVKPAVLRKVVVAIGLVVGLVYLVRLFR